MAQNGFQALLLPILIVVVIGIVTIAAWLAWFFTRRRSQSASSQDVEGLEPHSEPARDKAPASIAGPKSYLLGMSRSSAGGWAVHINGHRYTDLAAVPSAQLRQEIGSALQALTSFVQGTMDLSTPAPAQPEPASKDELADRSVSGAVSPPVQRLAYQPRGLVQTPIAVDAGAQVAAEVAARRITPMDGSVPTIDFAYEINVILEELLTATPSMKGRKILLQNIPGGINFFVDGAVYDEISEIPDTAIQSLIHQATREWERR